MKLSSFAYPGSDRAMLSGPAAITAVAAMIGAAFAGSTLLTPLYVIYKQQFGFSQITLTLVYAAYVVGNLAALLFFGRLSDDVGRRRTALPAMLIAIASALVFLFAEGVSWLYVGRFLSGVSIGIATGTGTAWLTEIIGRKDKSLATSITTGVNFFGLATSALVAGILAQYAPRPLQLPFVVYILALIAVTAVIWRTSEPGAQRRGFEPASLRPNASVPSDIWAAFIAPAVTGFCAMALVGFFAAIGPTMLAQDLHVTNHAVAGALFFELAIVVCLVILSTRSLPSWAAMLIGLGLMVPSIALVVLAQVLSSMRLLIAATALCGVAAGLGYRGSLQVINQIAPEQQRAAVVSCYFIWGFSGNALPVVGIGVVSALAGATLADTIFAGLIIVLALAAIGMCISYNRSKT